MSSTWIDIATLAVALVGVIGGLLALGQANRQRRLDIGSLYLQRYWDIDDDLLRVPKSTAEHTHARHRYLRLCEDEFEAARRGWLDRTQWAAWHAWLATTQASSRLEEDLAECDSEGANFELVRACVSCGPAHAWANCGARQVALAGN